MTVQTTDSERASQHPGSEIGSASELRSRLGAKGGADLVQGEGPNTAPRSTPRASSAPATEAGRFPKFVAAMGMQREGRRLNTGSGRSHGDSGAAASATTDRTTVAHGGANGTASRSEPSSAQATEARRFPRFVAAMGMQRERRGLNPGAGGRHGDSGAAGSAITDRAPIAHGGANGNLRAGSVPNLGVPVVAISIATAGALVLAAALSSAFSISPPDVEASLPPKKEPLAVVGIASSPALAEEPEALVKTRAAALVRGRISKSADTSDVVSDRDPRRLVENVGSTGLTVAGTNSADVADLVGATFSSGPHVNGLMANGADANDVMLDQDPPQLPEHMDSKVATASSPDATDVVGASSDAGPQFAAEAMTHAPSGAMPESSVPSSENAAQEDAGTSYRIQMAAFRVKANVEPFWNKLAAESGSLEIQDKVSVERIASSDGALYLLQAGPFTSRDQAQSTCDALLRSDFQCFVVGEQE